MKHALRCTLLGAGVFLLLGNHKALAAQDQGDTAATAQTVRKLFQNGTAHYNLGEYREAIRDYKEAYRLKQDPVFLFNIGQAHRQLAEWELAAQSYRAYLRVQPQAKNRAAVEQFIRDAETALAAERAGRPPTSVEAPQELQTGPGGPGGTGRGTARNPAGGKSGPEAKQPSAATAGSASPVSQALDLKHAPTPAEVPRKKSRTGLWAGIGVGAAVVVGGAVGLGIGLGTAGPKAPDTYFGTTPVRFP